MTKRKIAVVVTARPSYSRIKTALKAIDEHPDLELQLIIGASALLDRYGNAIEVIEKDGFKVIAKVFSILEGENLTTQAKTAGLGILELSSVFERLQPYAVITVADRFETISTAIAATYMNIPLVHIQGGEVTGNIDEKVRHAITKLSDLHMVASSKAKERVIKMGENPKKVFMTGCPSIDIADEVLENSSMNFNPIEKYGGVGNDLDYKSGYIVVMQHPDTNEYSQSREHIEETLNSINELQIPTFWFWPNVDAGSDGTSKGIRAFRETHTNTKIHFFKNMTPKDFLQVLKNSLCLIGNSSVGIRECAYLGVPVVNIGLRQIGRERGKNTIDVGYKKDEIREAILNQIRHGHFESDKIYGNGDAGKQIAELLVTQDLTFHKILRY